MVHEAQCRKRDVAAHGGRAAPGAGTCRRGVVVLSCAAAILASVPGRSPGADGREVVVLYNSKLSESRQVAEYYAQRRQVPSNQVIGLALPTSEAMSRSEYLTQLQAPLVGRLDARKLFVFTNHPAGGRAVAEARIRFLALCYGVPIKVKPDATLVEAQSEKLFPELRRNEASVDSELSCLPLVQSPFMWTGPRPNRLYGATNASLLHPTNGLLLVSRLDGPTAAMACGLVDKALTAERDGLWGRAYFDVGHGQGNEAYRQGDQSLGGAAELCRRLGFETVVDTNRATFPAGQPLPQAACYAGWYASQASGPFGWYGVEFMPGAFAYHLHSFSAATLRSTDHHWAGPLVAHGATATMGSVYEPYLAATPDMNVFFARFIYFGFTFAEAAWACQPVVSWQNLAVGDPLYCPFALRPDQRLRDLDQRGSRLVEWFGLMRANQLLATGSSLGTVIDMLSQSRQTARSAVLQEKLGDLQWAHKRLSDALGAWDQALKLEPTRLQKLSLLLKLIDRLTLYGRRAEALDCGEQLLKGYPDYPDRLAIWQKLLPLARHLNRPETIERCELEIERLTPPPPADTTTTPK